MEPKLTRDMMEALARPFEAEAVQWKPGATNPDKTRGLALAYVDLRHYIDRLNEVAGPDWSDDYEVQAGGTVVLCRLTLAGVTRADVGEASSSDENTATTALAQAFKRACVKFGLGAYLYRLPRLWVEYDPQKKRFTDAAMRRLATAVSDGNSLPEPRPAGNGDKVDEKDAGPANGNADPTAFWSAVNRLGLDRGKALEIAKGPGTWAEKLSALNGS
jgi:hypothetical protein